MIIQGSNTPITLTMDSDVSTIPTLVATLWADEKLLKRWDTADMTIEGATISLPLTEAETAKMKAGKAVVNVKGLDTNSTTIFWDEAVINIVSRKDRNITLTE